MDYQVICFFKICKFKNGLVDTKKYMLCEDVRNLHLGVKLDETGNWLLKLSDEPLTAQDLGEGKMTQVRYKNGKVTISRHDACGPELVEGRGPQFNALYDKNKVHYVYSVCFKSPYDYYLSNEIVEIFLPQTKIEEADYTNSKTHTFHTKLNHLLSGRKTLKMSVVLPDAIAERQERIKIIIMIEKETDVKIKNITTRLVEYVLLANKTCKCHGFEKVSVVSQDIREHEVLLSVPKSIENNEYEGEDIVRREYLLRVEAELPFPYSDVLYDIPLQISNDWAD